MVDAMFRCENNNFPIVLTVHDDIMGEVPLDSDKKLLESCMLETEQWVKDWKIPINVEMGEGTRFKK
jgi:hypothetical protein